MSDFRINWQQAARKPAALVLYSKGVDMGPPNRGTTICHLDEAGTYHGCRDVAPSIDHDGIVSAWVDDARAKGLAVIDHRVNWSSPSEHGAHDASVYYSNVMV